MTFKATSNPSYSTVYDSVNATGGRTGLETEETCGSVWPVSEIWLFCTVWNQLSTVCPHNMIFKKPQNWEFFSQKSYLSRIFFHYPAISSRSSSLLEVIGASLPILNEIPIRCLLSIVQSTAGTCWKADNSFFSGWEWLYTVWAWHVRLFFAQYQLY